VGNRLAIAFALLGALCVLAAAMAWSTAARGAEPEKPEDVQRVERAITELAAAKRDAAGEVKANKQAATKALSKCERAGPGWNAIRAVKIPAQRSLYRRGARTARARRQARIRSVTLARAHTTDPSLPLSQRIRATSCQRPGPTRVRRGIHSKRKRPRSLTRIRPIRNAFWSERSDMRTVRLQNSITGHPLPVTTSV